MGDRIKVIMDCDPGIDDGIALAYAAAHQDELELLAITTFAGNEECTGTGRFLRTESSCGKRPGAPSCKRAVSCRRIPRRDRPWPLCSAGDKKRARIRQCSAFYP